MSRSGWLVVDKPQGISSAAVVARLKKHLSLPRGFKIGHAGTLDPMATGMLVIALGDATKLIEYAMNGEKTYQFTITFGETRDTDDATGEVVEANDQRPTINEINAVLPKFIGKISQMPPIYSALKVDGKRAYALARAGQEVELKPREIEVYRWSVVGGQENSSAITDHRPLTTITLEVQCSKGTYVRSLARDIAAAVGCLGHVSMLRRTASGCFTEGMMKQLERAQDVLPLDIVLGDMPVVNIDERAFRSVRHGNPVSAPSHLQEGVVRVNFGGELVALAQHETRQLKPIRVFGTNA